MSRVWVTCGLLLLGCNDKAKPEYDRCVERDRNYDVPGAYSACAAAALADPNSVSGQAAQKKLDNMQSVVDKLRTERDEKDARDKAIKRDEPPPPVNTATAPTAFIPPVIVTTFDGGSGGPYYVQALNLSMSGDNAGARALLEPRVFGAGRDKGAPDEVALLRGICKTQKDKNCQTAITQKYGR
jgi:hypothetical protein